MHQYRNRLPQLDGELFLTDGGLETTLVFHQSVDLPCFAAFDLLKDEHGKNKLREYYRTYLDLAKRYKTNFILESATWRSNTDWGNKIGYSQQALDVVNRVAIEEMELLKAEYKGQVDKIVISGCIGPHGDGYKPTNILTAKEAQAYHAAQVKVFAESNADLVTAITMNYSDEALGIINAAKSFDMPVVISFTLETDGKLASGETLQHAIEKVDAATNAYASYFMINCAHPNHFINVLNPNAAYLDRIRGIRANASTKSHAELDDAIELDAGDKHLLAVRYNDLNWLLPNFNIVGGCCGTDHTHLNEICSFWFDNVS